MPSLSSGTKNPKKRKNESKVSTKSSSKRRAVADDEAQDETVTILELETQISESRKYYNNIATLLSMLNIKESAQSPNLAVAVSLCRVFCRLIAGGQLAEDTRAVESERVVALWLQERLREYQNALLALIERGDPSSQVSISWSSHLIRQLLMIPRLRLSPFACA
jgi:U3 small nucleolar RNA-associated protein 19